MAVDINWDTEKYHNKFETEEHWMLKKKFIEAYKNKIPEERLICLAQVFVNIELLRCTYPDKVMEQITIMAKDIGHDYKAQENKCLQRTLVAASDAVLAKVKGSTLNTKLFKKIKAEIKFVKPLEKEEQHESTAAKFSTAIFSPMITSLQNVNTDVVTAQKTTNADTLFCGPVSQEERLSAIANHEDTFSVSANYGNSLSAIVNQEDLLSVTSDYGKTLSVATNQRDLHSAPLNHGDRISLVNHGNVLSATASYGDSLFATSNHADALSATSNHADALSVTANHADATSAPANHEDALSSPANIEDVPSALAVLGDSRSCTTALQTNTNTTCSGADKDKFESLEETSSSLEAVFSQILLIRPLCSPMPECVRFLRSVFEQSSFKLHESFLTNDDKEICCTFGTRPSALVKMITFASGKGKTKRLARIAASENAVKYLLTKCYTLKVKILYSDEAISRSDIEAEDSCILPDDNIGTKMLKLMGWSGGALGKRGQGIKEPINANQICGRRKGLGMVKDEVDEIDTTPEFKEKLKRLLENFRNSDEMSDLIFSKTLTSEERECIHVTSTIVGKQLLQTKSYLKGENRFICVSKKRSYVQLLDMVMNAGGKTEKYELCPPGTLTLEKLKFLHLEISFSEFIKSPPLEWFTCIEETLQRMKLSNEDRFYKAFAALPSEVVARLPPSVFAQKVYCNLKNAVIEICEQFNEELFKREISSLSMIDEPSVLMENISSIASKLRINDNLVHSAFLQLLPPAISSILAPIEDLTTSQLKQLANKLLLFTRKNNLLSNTVNNTFSSTNETDKLPNGLRPFSANQHPVVCRTHLYLGQQALTCESWCQWPNKGNVNI